MSRGILMIMRAPKLIEYTLYGIRNISIYLAGE